VTTNGNGAALVPHTAPATPSRIGQGTAVEQSRAVAEVEAAIVVAMRHPRNTDLAVLDMQRSCSRKSLAEQAFFRFPRGRDDRGRPVHVTGESVHLARELARCWGNVQYGIKELRRDDEFGQSEMLSFAWDVQTNTRSETTFVVPHLRDKKGGAERLTDVRDIYENNANMGARRVREMIFAILPRWFTEEAVATCYRTLESDEDGTLPERIEKCAHAFSQMGITVPQLEARLGAPRSAWQPTDLAQLTVIFRSIQRQEVRKDDEFPAGAERTTAADLVGDAPVPPAASTPDPAAQNPPPPASEAAAPSERPAATRASLGKALARLPLGPAEDVGQFIAWRTGRPVTSLTDLTREEITSLDAYIGQVLAAAGDDTAAAAEAIWTEYRAAGEGQQTLDGAQ
jgi:hypothetical protein